MPTPAPLSHFPMIGGRGREILDDLMGTFQNLGKQLFSGMSESERTTQMMDTITRNLTDPLDASKIIDITRKCR